MLPLSIPIALGGSTMEPVQYNSLRVSTEDTNINESLSALDEEKSRM